MQAAALIEAFSEAAFNQTMMTSYWNDQYTLFQQQHCHRKDIFNFFFFSQRLEQRKNTITILVYVATSADGH